VSTQTAQRQAVRAGRAAGVQFEQAMNPPGFAPAHGSVPFGLEPTVARRFGAGGRCGASCLTC
jgi:hypothetical protein